MQIDNTQQIGVTLVPDGTFSGIVSWEVLSGNSTVRDVSADGLQATLRSEDGIGTTVYKASGSPAPGVDPISVEITLDVVAAQAHGFQANFGTPVPKTP